MNKEDLNHPHDCLTKEILSRKENARDFFFHYLPAHIRDLLDLDSLEICKDSFIDAHLDEYFSDLLYQINLQNASADQEDAEEEEKAAAEQQPQREKGYVYVLFEHKSTPQEWIAFHLLRYQVRIWELFLKQNDSARRLPVIIPLVLYHGKKKWRVGLQFSDLFVNPKGGLMAFIPDFTYLLCDLSVLGDDQIRGRAIMRLFFVLLKYIHDPALLRYLRELLPDLLHDPLLSGQELQGILTTIFRYIICVSDVVSVDEIKEIVETGLGKDKEDLIMTLAEQLIQQGMQQGMQQGIQQGEIKKAREAIVDVLETRFGPVPSSVRERLSGISDQAALEDLLRKAVTVASVAEWENMTGGK
ncbi:MAG: Rpn family recombination-promoting nuclease/putative transposase [bacterium]